MFVVQKSECFPFGILLLHSVPLVLQLTRHYIKYLYFPEPIQEKVGQRSPEEKDAPKEGQTHEEIIVS